MNTQEVKWNIIYMFVVPLFFVLLMTYFVITRNGTEQIASASPEFIVELVSMVLVSITAIACLVTAAIAAQPRYHW